MNILIQLGHPAHFHFYKYTINNLQRDGHKVYILIKTKDILEQLLKDAGLPYVNIYSTVRKNSRLALVKAVSIRLWRIAKFTISHHIDLLTGSSTEIAQVAWLLRRHSVILGEDDAAVVPEFVALAKHFMDSYLTPDVCDMGPIDNRVTKYCGYQKMAYLQPKYFTPDKSVAAKYVDMTKPYFIIRFAQLKAYHDLHATATGITTEIAQNIIDLLLPHGNVYITSERELEPQFEQYRLNISILDIHHVLAFASIYIGDSQSMAAESGILGTPFIRYNDFVGRIGYLKDLEDNYNLGYGIKTSDTNRLYDTIKLLLDMPDREAVFMNRRKNLLNDKIDVTAFYTWFFENYPESKKIMKNNPDYQFNFK